MRDGYADLIIKPAVNLAISFGPSLLAADRAASSSSRTWHDADGNPRSADMRNVFASSTSARCR